MILQLVLEFKNWLQITIYAVKSMVGGNLDRCVFIYNRKRHWNRSHFAWQYAQLSRC